LWVMEPFSIGIRVGTHSKGKGFLFFLFFLCDP